MHDKMKSYDQADFPARIRLAFDSRHDTENGKLDIKHENNDI